MMHISSVFSREVWPPACSYAGVVSTSSMLTPPFFCRLAWWTHDIGAIGGCDVTSPNYRELLIRWFQFGLVSLFKHQSVELWGACLFVWVLVSGKYLARSYALHPPLPV